MRKTKYTVKYTTGFKKDYKRAIKRGLKIELLEQVVALLAMGEPLPEKNRDHDLSGDWVGHRECHILPDWLLIYRIEDDVAGSDAGPHRVTQRLVRQISRLPPYGETCTAVFLCGKGCRGTRRPRKGSPKRRVPFTVPAPGRGAYPVPGGPVGSAALRSRSTAFSSSRIAFMSMVSTCFWAVSRSISRCHALGVISSPLSFSSFRYRAAAS